MSVLEEVLFTGTKTEEIQKKAADQAKDEIKVSSMSKADPDVTHESEWRRIVSAADEEDQRIAMEVIIIKNPFIVIDVLKEYMSSMYADLKSLREIFTNKETHEDDVCGGDRI